MKKVYLAVAFIYFLSNQLNSQIIDSTINKYANEYPQEKVHIHFDKGIYNRGETIWFKAYIISGLELSDCSKNFYIDWFDDKGNLITHTVSPMFESSARGQLFIPESYTGKFIHIKAYTQWMLNFDSSFLYNKDIKVDQSVPIDNIPKVENGKKANKAANKEVKEIKSATPPKNHVASIHFFPEGGVLLNGVVNRVAFLINNEFGLPVNAIGCLKNNKGEFVDSFVTEHDGMGSFTLQPDSSQPFTATWLDEYGVTHNSPFQQAQENGASLQVEPTKSKTIFFVNRTKDANESMKVMYVIAHMHQHEVYKSKINLSNRLAAIGEIPTKDLPTGVLQITLFDKDYLPIAERIVFVNNYQHLFKPQVRITKAGLDKREKNTIEIEVDDSTLSNMSLAITDAGLLTDAQNHIVSDLLLCGDVKGYIHNPAYYFASKEDSVFRHLDLVMLTHGWRKFNWKEVAQGKLPSFSNTKETDYMQIKGTIFGNLNKSAMQNQKVFLILQGKDSSKQNLFLDVDKAGNFIQKGVMFYDTIYVYYQLVGDKRFTDRYEFSFQTGLVQPPSKLYNGKYPSPYLWNYDVTDTSLLERSRIFYNEKQKLIRRQADAELAEVTVTTKKKRPIDVLDEKYTSGLFAGGDSKQFDVTNDPFAAAAIDIFTYLQGRVAGLQINNSGGTVSLNWRGHSPDLFLDEIPTDADMLKTISMNDVAYVKVFSPPFFGASGGGAGGAISVYTRRGADVKPTPGTGLAFKRLAGFTLYKEFYNPDYQNNPPQTFNEDARTTLYWNPYLLTYGKTHTIQIVFYNNDISKRLRLVLEGVNTEGKLARVEKIIE